MFSTLKGKFQFMQNGLSASFRNFKVKDEEHDSVLRPPVNFDAGSGIIIKNEIEYSDMRSLFEANAQKAELVDQVITEIHGRLGKQLHSLQEINIFAANIPKMVKKIESISEELITLQNSAAQIEEFLVIFEDLVETEEYKQKMLKEEYEYTMFIEKKNQELDHLKKKLEEEYFEKLYQKEKEMTDTLKEKQELYDMAFRQDMQLYKEEGIIPNLRSRSSEVNSKVSLEDVIIEDDLKELNELLES